jgi:hypothetical protein
MMTPVFLALSLLAPATEGGPSDQADWLELDREIASLGAPGAQNPYDGALGHIAFELITSYQASNGEFYEVGGDDILGAELRRARLIWTGAVGEMRYVISGDLESGTMELKDAYAAWTCSDSLDFQFGRYKNPLLWGGRLTSFADPFLDVPITTEENNDRFTGILVEGGMADFSALLSVQNGVDDLSDKQLIVGRLQWDILGESAFGRWHGAYGYGEELAFSAAVAASDDGAIENGTVIAEELGLVARPFSLRGEAVQYDDEYDVGSSLDPDDTLGIAKDGTSPTSLTAGYLFGDDTFELLARWERFDDLAETDRLSFGLVWYSSYGPNGRWALTYQELGSEDELLEGERFELSFALANS